MWGGLLLGLVLGAAAQASRFCIHGALVDRFTFGGKARLASWVLALVVATLGTQALIALQLFDPTVTTAWSARFPWLSYAVGGLLFGYGMVLAAGCPQRALVKTGSGNLKALVVLLVAALAALMTLRGALAELRVQVLDAWSLSLQGPQDLGSLLATVLPLPAQALRWALALGLSAAGLLWVWRARGEMGRAHWIGALVVGALVPAAWWLTGQVGFVPEHPETLETVWVGTQSGRPEGLSFVAPVAYLVNLLTFWTDTNTTATFGINLALGVLAGSFVSAKLRGDFRVESFKDANELASHLLGGLLMGFGGVTALGCSVGQGVTGVAMLSGGAFIAVAGIVAGAGLAVRLRSRRQARARGAVGLAAS